MDRIREPRRTTMAANGLSRRRHRSNSLRDSPEEDGPMELQEPSRLRDRVSVKKDRDRERDRDRDRERDRDRSSRSKRRRGDRLMHSNNREDGGDDSSEESVNDDEDVDDDVGGGSVRMLPLNPSSLSSSSLSNHRKSFPPAKDFRAPPTWKAADEMIGVSVPRRARSASAKRLHECWALNGGIIGEQFHRQASTSPVRTSAAAMGIGPSPSPASPSSSNASGRKKMKPSGPKLRPPKSSSKSSAQDDIEIEIAEVLYGMGRQPQGISNQETSANDLLKSDSNDTNKSFADGKSWVSSPISNSQSTPALSSSVPPQNSRTSITILSSVAAPKRKRPRHFKYEDENPTNFTPLDSPMPSTTKAETDQPLKVETCSPSFDKNTGSAPESGGIAFDLANAEVVPASSEPQLESVKFESNVSSDSKPVTEESVRQDVGFSKEPESPKNESTVPNLDDDREDVKATKANLIVSGSGNLQEGKSKIDLTALPPSSRSPPERDVDINAGNPKFLAADAELDANAMVKEDDKSLKMNKDEAVAEETKHRAVVEEADTQKPANALKDTNMSIHLDLEKVDKDIGNGSMVGKRHQQHAQRQQQPPPPPNAEMAVQSSSVPLPLSVPSWPGGLPPMGYMTPLQGVVSKDGATVSPAAIPPPHLLFNQPRPKRCATHCYIARTISYHQQLARMNSFWPAAAGSASLYGAKPCNLNVVPSTELQGNVVSRASNSAQDKGHSLAMFPGPIGKEKGSQAVSMESAQRKQMLIQQALPPGAPSNILHSPAFIFPLNQQQAAATASVRPGSVKSLTPSGNVISSSGTSNAIPASVSATGAAAAPTMSFSYPNMPGNETQYLAILQNNAYPFTIPAHVGGSPAYRGTHAQALPFFNGPFYSSQMIHPSQLQQQQLPAQSQQNLQGHQNASMSNGSSSSQKHLQNQQQKPNASGSNVVAGLQGFPSSSSNQPSQSLQQQRQHLSNHHASHPPHLESEICAEDSPSTADSRLSRATMSIYGHNFAMPMQPPNFAMMTPAAIGGVGAATVANGISHSEKKPQQHTGTKAGIEASQAFAMSFASVNGATAATGLDLSSIAQNHPILQSHNFQIMAAQAAQQKKNYRASEEGKTGDSSNTDDDRKAGVGKVAATVGQSIAFSRHDAPDPSVSGNTVLDSSARTLNLGSAPSRTTASVMPAAISTVTQQQMQQRSQQQQQPQIIQIQNHPQFTAGSAARSKTPSTSNGSAYSDHLPAASSVATKFTNSVSAYPQNLSQSGSTAAHLSQWKNSVRPTTSQSLSSMAPTPSASVKTVPQQQARTQQAHTHISFAVNAKSSTATQGQPSVSTHSSSPQVMVASPTTSSVSKSAGSPRTTSTGNKVGQASSLSTQLTKNSQAVPSRKSLPGGGRNTPLVLSGPQLTTSSSSGVKPQLAQQPQQMSKQTSQQAELFSNAYMPPQGSQSSSSMSTTSAAGGYYLQRRVLDPHMQRQSSSVSTSNGMLSLCPAVTIINTSSADSSKVAAATANNMKVGGLPTHGFLHPAHFAAAQSAGNHHQFVHTSFSYALPAAVQVKPADQKQPAGE